MKCLLKQENVCGTADAGAAGHMRCLLKRRKDTSKVRIEVDVKVDLGAALPAAVVRAPILEVSLSYLSIVLIVASPCT